VAATLALGIFPGAFLDTLLPSGEPGQEPAAVMVDQVTEVPVEE
jgi:NADH-quinone oxidoreductase subunit N